MRKDTVLELRKYASLDEITEEMQQEAREKIPTIEAEISEAKQAIEKIKQRLQGIRQREVELAAIQAKGADLLEVYGKQAVSGGEVENIIEEISNLTAEEGERKVELALLSAEGKNLKPLLPVQEAHLTKLLQDKKDAETLVEEIGVCLLSQEYNRKAAEFAPIVQQLWEARLRLRLEPYHLAKPWNNSWDYTVFESIPRLDFAWNTFWGSGSGVPSPGRSDQIAYFRRVILGHRPPWKG